MKQLIVYFLKFKVEKNTQNKKTFQVSDYLKGLRGVLKKVLSFIITQERT